MREKEYIERGALIAAMHKQTEQYHLRVAMEFPAADVEPVVRGEWRDGKCTNCGCFGYPTFDGGNERTAYCPFCGAHMERSGDA